MIRNKISALFTKWICMILVAALLMPAYSKPAQAADQVLINEDFSNTGKYTVDSAIPYGTTSNFETWQRAGSANTTVHPIIRKDTVTGITYVEMVNTAGTDSYYLGMRFPAQSGVISFEFDANLPAASGVRLFLMNGSITDTSKSAVFLRLNDQLAVSGKPAGQGLIQSITGLKQFAMNSTNWYRVKLFVNTYTKSYKASVVNLSNADDKVEWEEPFYVNTIPAISSFGFQALRNGGKIRLTNVKMTKMDLNLSNLVINDGASTLTPSFDPIVTNYSIDIPYSATSVAVSPFASNPQGVLVKVDGVNAASGSSSVVPIQGTTQKIEVTVHNSVTTDVYSAYTLTVNKLAKAPNLNYVRTEAKDSKVLIGWEETLDMGYTSANIYRVNSDNTETLLTTVPKGTYIAEVPGLSNGISYSFKVKGVYQYTNEAPIESAGIAVTAVPTKFAPRQMESLDRGIVAVKESNHVYVGWRLLGTDPDGIAFNLYRDGVKLNAEPITGATNYQDAGGTENSRYFVRTVLNGAEQRQSETVQAWGTNYKDLPIQKPAGGVTPAGEAYTYRANDATVGDLDGDGQYEFVLKWDPSNSKDNSQGGYTGETILDAYRRNSSMADQSRA